VMNNADGDAVRQRTGLAGEKEDRPEWTNGQALDQGFRAVCCSIR
jgi:hypothetical protein